MAAYTNIDGLISSLLEVEDYLKEKKRELLCLAETKLREEIQLSFKEEGYTIWRRDRVGKGGGGLLVVVCEDVQMDNLQYGNGMVEVIGITVEIKEKRKALLVYVPV